MLESVEELADWGLLEAAGAASLERKGEAHAIAGISLGMRMFAARDLARALGLADSEVFDPVAHGKPNTGTAHVQLISDTMRPANASLVRGNVLGSVGSPAA